MGELVSIQLPNGTPGQANQATWTPERGARVWAILMTFATDANVAARDVVFDVEHGSNIVYRSNAVVGQTASVTATYRYSRQAAIGGLNQSQIPDAFHVGQGGRFNIEITGGPVQAGDVITNIFLVVEYGN